jgi:hypothetical protein
MNITTIPHVKFSAHKGKLLSALALSTALVIGAPNSVQAGGKKSLPPTPEQTQQCAEREAKASKNLTIGAVIGLPLLLVGLFATRKRVRDGKSVL